MDGGNAKGEASSKMCRQTWHGDSVYSHATRKLVLRREGPKQGPTSRNVSTEGMRPEEEGVGQVC